MSRGWGHAVSKAVQHRSCHAPIGNTEAIRHVLLLFHFSTNCAYKKAGCSEQYQGLFFLVGV